MDRLTLAEKLQQAEETSNDLWQDIDPSEAQLERAQSERTLAFNDVTSLEVELAVSESPNKEIDIREELRKARIELAEANRNLRQAEVKYLTLLSNIEVQHAIIDQIQERLESLPSGPHARRIASHKRHRKSW